MAILTADPLSLEVRLHDVVEGRDGLIEVVFAIWFRWFGEALVRDDLLNRVNPAQQGRPPGAFLAYDFDGPDLIDMIDRVLANNEPGEYTVLEDDFTLAIYPELFFPFVDDRSKLRTAMERRLWREGPYADRVPQVPESIELFQVIASVGTHNFRDSPGCSGDGLAFHLTVGRHDVSDFLADLREEFRVVPVAHRQALLKQPGHRRGIVDQGGGAHGA